MVLTVSFALSPVTGLSCHRRLADKSAKLDISVGISGPHDFTVRRHAPSSEAQPASTASRLAFVTIAIRPSSETRRAESARDLGVGSIIPTCGKLTRRANQVLGPRSCFNKKIKAALGLDLPPGGSSNLWSASAWSRVRPVQPIATAQQPLREGASLPHN